MIFNLELNANKIREKEMVRLDLSRSVVFPEPSPQVTAIEVQMEDGGEIYNVFSEDQEKWFLDYAYTSLGEKQITVTAYLDTDPVETVTDITTLEVVEADDDKHFAGDRELLNYQSDVFRFLPEGRNNFNYIHRTVRELFLNWLMISNIRKADASFFSVDDLLAFEEVKELGRFWALSLIFSNASNKQDDYFKEKQKEFYGKVKDQKSIVIYTLNQSTNETLLRAFLDNSTVRLYRR